MEGDYLFLWIQFSEYIIDTYLVVECELFDTSKKIRALTIGKWMEFFEALTRYAYSWNLESRIISIFWGFHRKIFDWKLTEYLFILQSLFCVLCW